MMRQASRDQQASLHATNHSIMVMQQTLANIPDTIDKALDDAVSRRTRGALKELKEPPTESKEAKAERLQAEKVAKAADKAKKAESKAKESKEKAKKDPASKVPADKVASKKKLEEKIDSAQQLYDAASILRNKAERSSSPARKDALLERAQKKEDKADGVVDGISTSDSADDEDSSAGSSEDSTAAQDPTGNDEGTDAKKAPLDPLKSRRGLYTPEDWPLFLPASNPMAADKLITAIREEFKDLPQTTLIALAMKGLKSYIEEVHAGKPRDHADATQHLVVLFGALCCLPEANKLTGIALALQVHANDTLPAIFRKIAAAMKKQQSEKVDPKSTKPEAPKKLPPTSNAYEEDTYKPKRQQYKSGGGSWRRRRGGGY